LDRFFYICAAVAGFTGVGLDAFAAHGLKGRLAPTALPIFETAVRYQILHALALFAVAWAWWRWRHRAIAAAGVSFLGGLVFFSGSIYIRSLTGLPWPGFLTPLGGMAFLAGWLCLVVGVWRAPPAR
jgi:uncharacterized membrane protein YgdD (TMEM256/DUF423 family)